MSEFHDDKRKVVPIRPGIQKQKTKTQHLDLARQLLASAQPVAGSCMDVVNQLVRTVEQLQQKMGLVEQLLAGHELKKSLFGSWFYQYRI